MIAALFMTGMAERNASRYYRLYADTLYLAEGGIEAALDGFASDIANYQVAADVIAYNDSVTYASRGNFTVNATISRIESTDRVVMEGLTNVIVRNYLVNCTVTHPEDPTVSLSAHQIVSRRLIPTFQHAVFYQDDLELVPGQDMNLSGRLHCNNDIYIDAYESRTLYVNSTALHSAGNIYNNRKHENHDQELGEVMIRINGSGPITYAAMNNYDSEAANWTAGAMTRWGGTVQSAVHGVTELTAPSVASISPTGYYSNQADVKVVNGQLYKGGVLLTEGVDYPSGTVSTNTTFYNNREGKWVRMTNIDLHKLSGGGYTTCGAAHNQSCPNNMPSNGLLYATRNDNTSAEQPGIRLFNGTTLNTNVGLTVVSNDPVYVQGNYNINSEKPASVICDALNILSNAWKDSNSQNWNARDPNATTVNCAFIAGIKTTIEGNPGTYNGGLENYPRLHEDWAAASTILTIRGSFVALWNSQIAVGNWVFGNPHYSAPRRNWDYNPNFNNVTKLPPFTPWAVEMERVAWWVD
jgi:hypothetical protein